MPEAKMVLGREVPSYCRSVMKGDIELIENAYAERRDINTTLDNKSRCLLHYGVLATVSPEKRYRNLELLLNLGADLEQRDECGRTPLHLAVLLEDLKAVDVLLGGGCNPRAKCHGNSLLHLATISGNVAMFDKVRGIPGFNPCDLTEYGYTMIHLATLYDQHQMIPLLKKCGVNIDQASGIEIASTDMYQKPVMPVGIPEYYQYVLQYMQSDVSKKMADAVMKVVSCSSVEKMHALADSLRGIRGNSIIDEQPLFCAVYFGFLLTVKALVEEGADTSIVDADGNSLLHSAACFGHLDIVKYLFPLCVCVSSRSHPVNTATVFDAVDVVRYLVREYHRFGLPIESVSCNSDEVLLLSLLDLAVSANRPRIIQLALEMECQGVIGKSQNYKNPSILLLKSVAGGWAMNLFSKIIPQMAPLFDSEKHQQDVISFILGLPGCDPMQRVPDVDCCALDLAVLFSQSNALDVLLSYLERHDIQLPTSIFCSPDVELPLPHLCVCMPWMFREDPILLDDEVLGPILSSIPYPEDIFYSTFDVLLTHGYNVNSRDSNGLTCLDYAVVLCESPKVQEFLRLRGASTAEELQHEVILQAVKNLLPLVLSVLRYISAEALMAQFCGHLHSTQPSTSPPSQMSEIKLEDGISLARRDILIMAAHWSTIAVRLGIEQPIIDIIKHDYPSQAERSCHEMLRRWCARDELTGEQPRTLDTVLTAMKACGLEEYAGKVQGRPTNV